MKMNLMERKCYFKYVDLLPFVYKEMDAYLDCFVVIPELEGELWYPGGRGGGHCPGLTLPLLALVLLLVVVVVVVQSSDRYYFN